MMILKWGFRIVLGKVDDADCEARLEKLMLFLKDGITKKVESLQINLKFDNFKLFVRK